MSTAIIFVFFVCFLTPGHPDAQPWASECPDVKNYKWRLNPVWRRMLYSCTHMTTLGVTASPRNILANSGDSASVVFYRKNFTRQLHRTFFRTTQNVSVYNARPWGNGSLYLRHRESVQSSTHNMYCLGLFGFVVGSIVGRLKPTGSEIFRRYNLFVHRYLILNKQQKQQNARENA